MSINLIVTAYMAPLFGLLFLFALILINPLFTKRQTACLLLAAGINLLLIISTSLDYIFAELNWENMWLMRRVTSFLNFGASPLVPILLLNIFSQRKMNRLWYLPAALNLLLSFTSMFGKLVFYIAPDNGYGRGTLFFIPFLTTLFYIGLLITLPVHFLAQSKKIERAFLVGVVGMLLISMLFEIQFGYHFLNWGCSALGLIMYYLLLNIQGFIIDPLTGIYNRIRYNRDLAGTEQISRCVIVSIDINGFKEVNDTYGHDAGDQFLIRFVELLYARMEKLATLYRVGGDEFVLLSKKTAMQPMQEAVERAQEEIAALGIRFAYGIAEYLPKDNLQEVLKAVDGSMYQNKRRMKGEVQS